MPVCIKSSLGVMREVQFQAVYRKWTDMVCNSACMLALLAVLAGVVAAGGHPTNAYQPYKTVAAHPDLDQVTAARRGFSALMPQLVNVCATGALDAATAAIIASAGMLECLAGMWACYYRYVCIKSQYHLHVPLHIFSSAVPFSTIAMLSIMPRRTASAASVGSSKPRVSYQLEFCTATQ